MLELAALREAAALNPSRLLDEWQRCMERLKVAEAAGDVAALADIDMDFHNQMFICCDNGYLGSSYNFIRYQLLALRHRSPIEHCVDTHLVLVDAIARGDINGACELLTEHVDNTEQRYRDACNRA